MVKIRLRRVGGKKRPSYRVVVADARAPRDGAFISIIGHYNPLTDPETVVIDEEKARSWLEQGAQPTATAARLLAKAGIIEESELRKEKMKAVVATETKARKKKARASASEAPEASGEESQTATAEEPQAEAIEEPEASEEETQAEAIEEPESSKEEPQANSAEEPATGEEPSETIKEKT